MEISGWTLIALAGVLLVNTLLIVGLAVTLFAFNRKLDEALVQAAPLLQKATETISQMEETTSQLQQRVDRVLDKTSRLVDQVSERVDTTTAIAEEVVTEPLIGAASIVAGIHRGLRVYSERTSEKGTDSNGGHS